MANGNPFILGQYLPQETFRGRGGQLGGIGTAIAQERARGEKEQQANARNAQMQEEFKGVMSSNDPDQIAAFSFKYPEAAKQAQESFGIANPSTRGISTMGYGKALQAGNAEQAANQLDMYADQVEAAGGQPTNMRADAAGLRDGSIDMNTLEMGVAMTEPELWGNISKFRKSQAESGPEKMTEYQAAMIKGGDADREIRKIEDELKRDENKLKSETNQVKLNELKNKVAANEDKQLQIKKGRTEAAESVVDSGQSTLNLIDEISKHPGLSSAVGAKGASSLFGALDSPLSGTDAAGVNALIETLEAQNFLTAIGQFKSAGGAGALSDNEGKKLGAALSNLNTSQSEKDFNKSLNIIKSLVNKQISRANKQIDPQFSLGANSESSQSGNMSDNVDLSKLSLEELKAMRGRG